EFWKAMSTIQKTIGPRTTLILKHDSSVFSPIFQMPKWSKPSEATQANIQAAEQILNQSEEKISGAAPAQPSAPAPAQPSAPAPAQLFTPVPAQIPAP
ncbi:MAG: hypothetical protein IJK97_11370, partial [Thermoguttaceae bacterium]|nr:hypothetical protein [Thermoguttaceae bacterium]